MSTDTPQTDAETWRAGDLSIGSKVCADFARKLERELASAQAEKEKWEQIACDKLIEVCMQIEEKKIVTEQRDKLAEEIGQLKSRLTQTMGAVTISRNGYVQELEQQRDRLAEALRNTRPTLETDEATLRAIDIDGGGQFNAVHVQVSSRLERERDEARFDLDFRRELFKLQSNTLKSVTEQRDRLAEALERILSYQGKFAEEDPESIATEALQSLTRTNEH